MNIEEIKKESINYMLQMHLNTLKAIGTGGLIGDRKPCEIVETISFLHENGQMVVIESMNDWNMSEEYKDFIKLQLTSIYKEAYETIIKYAKSLKAADIEEQFKKGVNE